MSENSVTESDRPLNISNKSTSSPDPKLTGKTVSFAKDGNTKGPTEPLKGRPAAFVQFPDGLKIASLPTDTNDPAMNKANGEFNELGPFYEITHEKSQQIYDQVIQVYRQGGEGDPQSKNEQERKYGDAWCRAAHNYFLQNKWYLPARDLWLELWNSLALRQQKRRIRVPRALIGQFLTETEYSAGRLGEAFRWSILTHADNMLGKEQTAGAHSRHWLYGLFGVTDSEKKAIDMIAEKCRKDAEKQGWKTCHGYAEDVMRRCCEGPLGDSLFMRHSIRDEFPLCRTYLNILLDRAARARSNQLKGAYLEELAFYLFILFSGCIHRNVLDTAGASEYDLIGFNQSSNNHSFFIRFGAQFLVECKNWRKKVDVATVGYFLARMHLTRCLFGIVLSQRGVTGDAAKNSNALIRRTFDREGAICVVVTFNDLQRLCDGKQANMTSLLTERANELQFGKRR